MHESEGDYAPLEQSIANGAGDFGPLGLPKKQERLPLVMSKEEARRVLLCMTVEAKRKAAPAPPP
jgi:hypothetical protein